MNHLQTRINLTWNEEDPQHSHLILSIVGDQVMLEAFSPGQSDEERTHTRIFSLHESREGQEIKLILDNAVKSLNKVLDKRNSLL